MHACRLPRFLVTKHGRNDTSVLFTTKPAPGRGGDDGGGRGGRGSGGGRERRSGKRQRTGGDGDASCSRGGGTGAAPSAGDAVMSAADEATPAQQASEPTCAATLSCVIIVYSVVANSDTVHNRESYVFFL